MTEEERSYLEELNEYETWILETVQNHMKWSKKKTRWWYETINFHFGYISPRDLVLRFRGEYVVRVINALIQGNLP